MSYKAAIASLLAWLALLPAAAQSGVTALEVPFHRQQRDGCGAASVAMVLAYWQAQRPDPAQPMPSPQQVYASLYQPDLNGIPLADMKRYLEDHGLRAFTLRGAQADIEAQLRKGRPLIVATRNGSRKPIHFVVVTGADSRFVWMNDPTGRKPKRMKLSAFAGRWANADRWMLLAVPSTQAAAPLPEVASSAAQQSTVTGALPGSLLPRPKEN